MTSETERLKLIDELGAIQDRLAPYEADFKRREALKRTVRSWPEDDKKSGGVSVAYASKRYVVTLGAAENQRRIRSLADVFKAVGKTKFIGACSLTLKALGELLGDVKAADHVIEERTGPRPLTIAKAA